MGWAKSTKLIKIDCPTLLGCTRSVFILEFQSIPLAKIGVYIHVNGNDPPNRNIVSFRCLTPESSIPMGKVSFTFVQCVRWSNGNGYPWRRNNTSCLLQPLNLCPIPRTVKRLANMHSSKRKEQTQRGICTSSKIAHGDEVPCTHRKHIFTGASKGGHILNDLMEVKDTECPRTMQVRLANSWHVKRFLQGYDNIESSRRVDVNHIFDTIDEWFVQSELRVQVSLMSPQQRIYFLILDSGGRWQRMRSYGKRSIRIFPPGFAITHINYT